VTVSALALGATLIALPTAASASTAEWVSTAPAVLGGNSCASPSFNSVQAAVDEAATNATIHVCAGTYVEQVQITKTVKLVGTGSPIL
jgi:pectin methylesterase-like acyl-CoA thioesterase